MKISGFKKFLESSSFYKKDDWQSWIPEVYSFYIECTTLLEGFNFEVQKQHVRTGYGSTLVEVSTVLGADIYRNKHNVGFGQNFYRLNQLLEKRTLDELLKYYSDKRDYVDHLRASIDWKAARSTYPIPQNILDKLQSVDQFMSLENFLYGIYNKLGDNPNTSLAERIKDYLFDLKDEYSSDIFDFKILYFEFPIIVPTGRDASKISNLDILVRINAEHKSKFTSPMSSGPLFPPPSGSGKPGMIGMAKVDHYPHDYDFYILKIKL